MYVTEAACPGSLDHCFHVETVALRNPLTLLCAAGYQFFAGTTAGCFCFLYYVELTQHHAENVDTAKPCTHYTKSEINDCVPA